MPGSETTTCPQTPRLRLSAKNSAYHAINGFGCPSRGRGDGGLGLPLPGRQARRHNKRITSRSVQSFFSYELGRTGEADTGRAKYAALLHH